MRIALPLLLLAAACGGHARSSIGNQTAGGPLGPAPTVAWQATSDGDFSGDFVITGAPGLSADGSRVLLAKRGEDGARGAPNLALEVRDRDDRQLAHLVVMTPEQGEAYGGGAETPAAPPDLGPANAWIAGEHAKANFAPMTATDAVEGTETEAQEQAGEVPPRLATVGALVVSFDEGAHLIITDGGKPVLDRTMSAWQPPSYPMYEGAGPDEQCFNPVYLQRVYVDAAHHLAVLEVAFRGTDTCWEPDDEFHVVTW